MPFQARSLWQRSPAVAQLGLVLIVLFVAGHATERRATHALQILVAGNALHARCRMRIAQRKLRFVVLEQAGSGLPSLSVVAIGTGFSQRAFVLIVFLVATEAVFRGFLEKGALVASRAFRLGVLAKQRKSGFVMVKLGRLFCRIFRCGSRRSDDPACPCVCRLSCGSCSNLRPACPGTNYRCGRRCKRRCGACPSERSGCRCRG